jgi:hypothetical protein
MLAGGRESSSADGLSHGRTIWPKKTPDPFGERIFSQDLYHATIVAGRKGDTLG